MNIALDYDRTFTADPDFWRDVIELANNRGHKVYCVTMRYPLEKLEHDIPVEVIYTCRRAKANHVEALGIQVDMWIDDMPYFIHNDAIA